MRTVPSWASLTMIKFQLKGDPWAEIIRTKIDKNPCNLGLLILNPTL